MKNCFSYFLTIHYEPKDMKYNHEEDEKLNLKDPPEGPKIADS